MKKIILTLIFALIIGVGFTSCNECKIGYHTVDKIENIQQVRNNLSLIGYSDNNDVFYHGNNIIEHDNYLPSVSINDNDKFVLIHETYYQFDRFDSLLDSIKTKYPEAMITGSKSDMMITIDDNNHIEIRKELKDSTISISYSWDK